MIRRKRLMKTYLWIYVLGAVLGGIIGFAICDVAHAKTKAASTRVAEAFQVIPPQPRARGVVMRPPPQYIANRPSFYVSGKLMIYRECEVDLRQLRLAIDANRWNPVGAGHLDHVREGGAARCALSG